VKYTDAEIILVRKYLNNEYNDVQFNYWIAKNKFNKIKIYKLVDIARVAIPLYAFSIVLLFALAFHIVFLFCFGAMNI
jgi:hypothetical protein